MLNNILSKPILRLSVVILVNENILKISPLIRKDKLGLRHFARWSTRKPSKVFTPEDISSDNIASKEFYQSEYDTSKSSENKAVRDAKENANRESVSQNKKSSSEFNYKVLEEHDSTFSKLMTLVGNRKMRRKHDLMMLEGKRLNMDALQAGLKPRNVFFTRTSILEELNISPNSKVSLYKLPYKTINLWSNLDTPPGIIGFYNIPKQDDIVPKDTLPIKVLCDNVRDPGNLGSIIRVAASVGCTQVLLMKGCTDPWDSKVLRSASGGHFHIPIKMDLLWNEQGLLEPADQVFLADSHSVRSPDLPSVSYHKVNFSKCESVVVVIGGETEGLSSDALHLASHSRGSRLYIPLSNSMESLNSGCALSVILFEIKKQLLDSGIIQNNVREHSSDSVEELVTLKSHS